MASSSDVAPRGRHKRRQAADAARATEDGPPGPDADPTNPTLIKELLKEWSMGLISAVRLQKLAHRAFEDQKSLLKSLGISPDHIHANLRKFASLGDWGRTPNHINEALLTCLGKPRCPDAFVVQAPGVLLKSAGDAVDSTGPMDIGILLPHETDFIVDIRAIVAGWTG